MPHKLFVTKLLLVGLVYGLLSGISALAQDQSVALSKVTPAILNETHFADLDAYINDMLPQLGGSGAAVGIVQNGQIIYLKGFGFTELNGSIPVSGDTQFMIGSLTKSMTALMIGTLIEEDILEWDTPVSDVLPSFVLSNPSTTQSVTFRDLLSMRSGLPVFDAPIVLTTMSPEQVIESLARIPLSGQPGEAYHYSNLGFASAGFIAAIAAGGAYSDNVYETYAQLMQNRLFDPLSMGRTTFDFSGPIATQNRTAPIAFDIVAGKFDTIPFEFEHGGFAVTPAGGTTWSTAEDLAQYLNMQMSGGLASNGTRIISDALLEEMRMPQIRMSDDSSYSLGWVVGDYQGLQSIEYSGNNIGYSARLQFLPEANLGIVVLTNRGMSLLGPAVGFHAYELAFGLDHTSGEMVTQYNNQITGALSQMSSMLQTETDREMVSPYLGQYEQGISVRLDNAAELILDTPNGEYPLSAVQGQAGFFLIRNIGLLAAQFAENDEGIMTLTFVGTMDASQSPFVLKRLE